jgi:hypothetical protein
MKPLQTKSTFIIFLFSLMLVVSGCNNTDSEKTGTIQKKSPAIVGTWQQIALGENKVSDIIVKITFSEQKMTMDAPGCLIIGDYTTADNVLSFTITSAQGERCTTNQNIGKTDNVYYEIIDSKLTLTPLLGRKESEAVYKRISE